MLSGAHFNIRMVPLSLRHWKPGLVHRSMALSTELVKQKIAEKLDAVHVVSKTFF